MRKQEEKIDEAEIDAAVKAVNDRLENWTLWAKSAAYTRVLRPSEFLAVVVWVLELRKGSDLSESEMRDAVSHWKYVIFRGFEEKILVRLHGASLLPVPDAGGSDWVLSVSQLNDLMGRLPWAFDVAWALDEFRQSADALSDQLRTWKDAADLHKRESEGGKKPGWTHAKLSLIAAAINEGVKVDAIAKRAGITRQTLDEAIDRYKKNPQKYGATEIKEIRPPASAAGGFPLQDAWGGKAA
jgi:hypothetical protein